MTADPQSITFVSDGLRIVGDLYLPDNLDAEPRPAIVLCHGFGGLRGFWFPQFARHFNRAGYVVLAFDHRNTGDSDGMPRLHLDPLGQVADIRSAVSFLEERPEVRANGIGLYGISYGGANAVYAAAIDRRIATMICVVGYGDGERWLRSVRREWEWIEFRKRLDAELRARATGADYELVDTSDVLTRDPEALEHERAARAQDPDRVTQVTLATGDAIAAFKPETLVDRIAPRPSFFMGVEEDTLVPTAETLSLYDKAGEPKRLHLFPPIGHHSVYYGERLDELLGTAVAWFDEHLKLET